MSFRRISIEEAKTLLEERGALAVDVRNPLDFDMGHIQGACHLGNANLSDFLEDNAHERPLVVYCYHGHSSQSAAHYLTEHGFHEVYSMDGGIEMWRQHFPVTREN